MSETTGKKDGSAMREARRILRRVDMESDSAAVVAPARAHDSHADDDWIERTGTRIGRALSIVLFLALVVWLVWTMAQPGSPQ